MGIFSIRNKKLPIYFSASFSVVIVFIAIPILVHIVLVHTMSSFRPLFFHHNFTIQSAPFYCFISFHFADGVAFCENRERKKKQQNNFLSISLNYVYAKQTGRMKQRWHYSGMIRWVLSRIMRNRIKWKKFRLKFKQNIRSHHEANGFG